MVTTKVSICTSGYQELSIPLPKVNNKSKETSAMADSGAQMVVAGMNLDHSMGITRRELIPLATKVNAASDNGLGLIGGMLITITATDKRGNNRETRQLCYSSESIYTLYLSEQTCIDLGFLEEDFPNISATTGKLASTSSLEEGIPSTREPRTCS